ncbi:hypothetical protein EK21DRAFT_87062 [Setomelanomma holmii]|uniref:Uncharacterized protein n=1 Tax=Setomelanomma holmii TaxID=210430 RepID=A0A9P4LPQ8_9PLEO|nr:hypothetical protein EK21DRAFT_87062 [Setomelanomma holmii]
MAGGKIKKNISPWNLAQHGITYESDVYLVHDIPTSPNTRTLPGHIHAVGESLLSFEHIIPREWERDLRNESADFQHENLAPDWAKHPPTSAFVDRELFERETGEHSPEWRVAHDDLKRCKSAAKEARRLNGNLEPEWSLFWRTQVFELFDNQLRRQPALCSKIDTWSLYESVTWNEVKNFTEPSRDLIPRTLPKPDLTYAFPIQVEPPEELKGLARDDMMHAFSLQVLGKLQARGIHCAPTTGLRNWTDAPEKSYTWSNSDKSCFPWAVVEMKHDRTDQNEALATRCYCQAANAASRALDLQAQLFCLRKSPVALPPAATDALENENLCERLLNPTCLHSKKLAGHSSASRCWLPSPHFQIENFIESPKTQLAHAKRSTPDTNRYPCISPSPLRREIASPPGQSPQFEVPRNLPIPTSRISLSATASALHVSSAFTNNAHVPLFSGKFHAKISSLTTTPFPAALDYPFQADIQSSNNQVQNSPNSTNKVLPDADIIRAENLSEKLEKLLLFFNNCTPKPIKDGSPRPPETHEPTPQNACAVPTAITRVKVKDLQPHISSAKHPVSVDLQKSAATLCVMDDLIKGLESSSLEDPNHIRVQRNSSVSEACQSRSQEDDLTNWNTCVTPFSPRSQNDDVQSATKAVRSLSSTPERSDSRSSPTRKTQDDSVPAKVPQRQSMSPAASKTSISQESDEDVGPRSGKASTTWLNCESKQFKNGTAQTPFSETEERGNGLFCEWIDKFQTICFQTPYQNESLEELRLADYTQGRRFGSEYWQKLGVGEQSAAKVLEPGRVSEVELDSDAQEDPDSNAHSASEGYSESDQHTSSGEDSEYEDGSKPDNNSESESSSDCDRPTVLLQGFGSTATSRPFGSSTSSGLIGSGPSPKLFGHQNNKQVQLTTSYSLFGGFGSPKPDGDKAQPTSSLFGSAATSSAFGSSASSGLIGSGPSPKLFGHQNNKQGQLTTSYSLFGGFGSPKPDGDKAQPTSSLFGSAATSSAFGSSASSGLIGSGPSPKLFGHQNNKHVQLTTSSSLSGGFGSSRLFNSAAVSKLSGSQDDKQARIKPIRVAINGLTSHPISDERRIELSTLAGITSDLHEPDRQRIHDLAQRYRNPDGSCRVQLKSVVELLESMLSACEDQWFCES